MLTMEQCVNGNLYRVSARNISLGVYTAKAKGFIGIREKFDNTYLDTEYHWDFSPRFGTARPTEDLGPTPFDEPTSSTSGLYPYLAERSTCTECKKVGGYHTRDCSNDWWQIELRARERANEFLQAKPLHSDGGDKETEL